MFIIIVFEYPARQVDCNSIQVQQFNPVAGIEGVGRMVINFTENDLGGINNKSIY